MQLHAGGGCFVWDDNAERSESNTGGLLGKKSRRRTFQLSEHNTLPPFCTARAPSEHDLSPGSLRFVAIARMSCGFHQEKLESSALDIVVRKFYNMVRSLSRRFSLRSDPCARDHSFFIIRLHRISGLLGVLKKIAVRFNFEISPVNPWYFFDRKLSFRNRYRDVNNSRKFHFVWRRQNVEKCQCLPSLGDVTNPSPFYRHLHQEQSNEGLDHFIAGGSMFKTAPSPIFQYLGMEVVMQKGEKGLHCFWKHPKSCS